MAQVSVFEVNVFDGPLYEEIGEESSIVCDYFVVAIVAGGHAQVHPHPFPSRKDIRPSRGAETFASVVAARGALDPDYWVEFDDGREPLEDRRGPEAVEREKEDALLFETFGGSHRRVYRPFRSEE